MLAPRMHRRDDAPASNVSDRPDGPPIPAGALSTWLRIGTLVWLAQSFVIFILARLLLILGR